MALLGAWLLCGCGSAGNAQVEQRDSARQAGEPSSVPREAFRRDDEKRVIYLDTRIAPGQRRRFDIGLGSITLETRRASGGKLTFRYTPEVEGGYTVYECTVPVSATPLEFEITREGMPGATSVDLSACTVIFQGNVHFEQSDERVLNLVSWLNTKGVTLEYVKGSTGEGEWRVVKPKASDEYDVIFRIRSFPPDATEAAMREAIDVNLAYQLNARAHLAMSYAGFRGTHPAAKIPTSEGALPAIDGLPVTKVIEGWFLNYEAD